MEREIERKYRGEVSHSIDIAYGVTSLKKDQVSAQRLLELNRNHWEIENRIHYVRDVTYDEDRCRIRTDNAFEIDGIDQKYSYWPCQINGISIYSRCQ